MQWLIDMIKEFSNEKVLLFMVAFILYNEFSLRKMYEKRVAGKLEEIKEAITKGFNKQIKFCGWHLIANSGSKEDQEERFKKFLLEIEKDV